MTELDKEQQAKRNSIRKTSLILAAIIGLIVAGIAYWLLSSQSGTLRSFGAIGAGIVVAAALYYKNYRSAAKAATCPECHKPFTVSRTDRSETLTESVEREEIEKQDDGAVKTTTWTDEEYDVIETYTCANCNDVTTKEFSTTRRKNEKSTLKKPSGKKK